MIDEARLRDDLIRLLKATEDNIRRRCDEESGVNAPLQDRYEAARKAGRTGMTFSTWREGEITQAGVAWLLACVFVRFLEDNDMLGEVYIAGPGDRLKQAQDRVTRWYRSHALLSHREYLLDIFNELEHVPGLKGLLDGAHNPLWSLGPDGDGAKAILDFFQNADPDTQVLRHDFTDTAHSTRFLGDLYQNISEPARKRYALVQTPDFVVDFILDRTLTPALDEFGFRQLRLIDPACGSGHFLLAAFDRLFPLWDMNEADPVIAARNALDNIVGVDLNPYAVAIARFRLVVAALRACGIVELRRAPDWETHLAAGDSLLHGPRPDTRGIQRKLDRSTDRLEHFYVSEDAPSLQKYLSGDFEVVVGNPPYITVEDDVLREAYRSKFGSCSRDFQLSVPFTERFFDLAVQGERPGYVGMITSSAFASRSFGKRFVEKFLPLWDLTHVIDMSGVYLEGQYGTSTHIVLARNRKPGDGVKLRVVRGIRGAEGVPADPASAPVWTEIREHVDQPGFNGHYVSVADADRPMYYKHPWANGGGGAAELKQRLDGTNDTLDKRADEIGRTVVLGEEEFWFTGRSRAHSDCIAKPLVSGTGVREWQLTAEPALYPYDGIGGQVIAPLPVKTARRFWPYRRLLSARSVFKRSLAEAGKLWYEVLEHYRAKLRPGLSIALGEIATHNHFVLDRGGKIFNRTAPVIKLVSSAADSDYIGLLGTLNSSTTGFWLRQVCFPKGGDHVGRVGARIRKNLWEERFSFDATKVSKIPVPKGQPYDIAAKLQCLAEARARLMPDALLAGGVPTRASLDEAQDRARGLLLSMIALQEELDWHVYHLYGLLDESLTLPTDDVPPIRLGERAFEIVMARAVADGQLNTTWFSRHRSAPCPSIPEHWPERYRALVQRRIDTIKRNCDVALIEQPEYKRRWNLLTWDELEKDTLKNWLLDRLEDARYWPTEPPALTSVARLADAVRLESDFRQVAALYRGREDFDLPTLIQDLVAKESVPFLPVLRYRDSGVLKRRDWERIWNLQRQQDRGEKVEIPLPPEYEKDDFPSADFWRLRGKLDVPKERFISYPHLERNEDKSLVIAWAGYDHGQQALALASYCYEMRGNEAWDAERLTPILAGLQELQPWLDQWHGDLDPNNQQRLNESIRTFFESELSQLEITAEQVRAWRPPARARRGASAGRNR